MEKRLAHIEQIRDISPIYNKKGEEMRNKSATVLGWQCMIRPNEFKVGDLVVYIEVGSILPKKPEFEFLAKYDYRVKTQKYFKGSYISQGLILPLSTLPDFKGKTFSESSIGEDVTNLLGITKFYTKEEKAEFAEEERQRKTEKSKLKKFLMRYSWFRRLFLSRSKKRSFPYWISKTEERKLQNIPHVLEQFKDKEVYVTEKIDYQSVTFTGKLVPKIQWIHKLLLNYRKKNKFNKNWLYRLIKYIHLRYVAKYQFVVCSRNMTTNDKNSLYWKIAEKYNIEQILKENPTLTIQGEQGDTKVQGNKYDIKEPTLWVFNIIDHEKNYHYDYLEMWEFCEKYGLNIVPLLPSNNKTIAKSSEIPTKFAVEYKYKLSELGTTVQELVEFSKDKSVINPDIPREGIVVRCIENGKKVLSFKVINPDFEIKYKL